MVQVLGIGDNTVDIYVDQGVQFPGGNAVNVPVLMKRLGADAAYLGCVGNDSLGQIVAGALVAEGIDITHLRHGDAPNAWSTIRHVNNDRIFGENNPSLREGYCLTPEDFAWMGGFDLVHSSIYSKLENDLARIHAASRILSFDFSEEFSEEYLKKIALAVDIAFLSAGKRTFPQTEALARDVAALGPRLVVITRGAAGALAHEDGTTLTQPVLPTEVVDTLAAGDGFIAGFLMARLTGLSLKDQLVAGAKSAASVCRYRGAFGYETPIQPGQPGLPCPTDRSVARDTKQERKTT